MNHLELINRIVELELDMFERVRTAEPSACQEKAETFKSMRSMTHSTLSKETLESYLEDLQQANIENKNLLTLKYARMDGKIPPLKKNPVIDDIVRIEERWMMELSLRYPRIVKGNPGFGVYLSSELETYSDKTLDLYLGDVTRAENEGRNLSEERYNWLFEKIGYGSITEANEKLRDTKEDAS
ncbi:MAG: DUF4125 family protein [Chloroflexi bacterium]|nr:DUF4125 family protein [Chloroflexota bacterium]